MNTLQCKELIKKGIQLLDNKISVQLSAILHQHKFQQLEGRWRGLQYLVNNTPVSNNIKIKILNITKIEISTDLNTAADLYLTQMHRLLCNKEFCLPDSEPYSILIGDYEFSHTSDDIAFLKNMSQVARRSLCPFISAASTELFGFKNWHELSPSRNFSKIFNTQDFIYLTMPRVLARTPYTKNSSSAKNFTYDEFHNQINKPEPQHFTWMNAAYLMGTVLARAFHETGYFLNIHTENGNKIENLSQNKLNSSDKNINYSPLEVSISDTQKTQLTSSGLMPFYHFKNTNSAIFFETRSLHKIKTTDDIDAHSLSYTMIGSLFFRNAIIMARQRSYEYYDTEKLSQWLSAWINKYVLPDDIEILTENTLSIYPLSKASIYVKEIAGMSGVYRAEISLRPGIFKSSSTRSIKITTILANWN